MSANIIDYFIDKGATFSTKINLKLNTVDLDLSLYSFRGSIKNEDTIVPLTVVESGSDIILSLTHIETANLIAGVSAYDVEMVKDSDGSVTRILKGRVFIDEEVSI